jgi:predicted nucleic acid-binding protein
MPGKFLFDTNVIISFLNDDKLQPSDKHLKVDFLISVITELELLSSNNLTKSEENTINNLLKDTFIIEIKEKVKAKTIALRRKYGLKLPDAIIAASALVYKIPLVSDDKVFKRIKEIKLLTIKNFLDKKDI